MLKNKLAALFLSACLAVTGCSSWKTDKGGETSHKETAKEVTESLVPSGNQEQETSAEPSGQKAKELHLVNQKEMSFVSETGYYYITDSNTGLKNGGEGKHIMYMDFATKQEVFLCSEPGCKHDDKKCTAVLTDDIIASLGKALIFAVKDRLYLVCMDNLSENAISMKDLTIGDTGTEEPEKLPTTLYSMGLDGSDRRKEYTFGQDVLVDNTILSDGENLYFETKKITVSSDKEAKYQTASERVIARYNMKKESLETVCSLEFGDNVAWQMLGCTNRSVILYGIKYNHPLSLAEWNKLEQKELWEYENDSSQVFVQLDMTTGKRKQIYSVKNDVDSEISFTVSGDYLYLSQRKPQTIQKIDLKTGKAKKLAKLKQSFIIGSLSDALCCGAWDRKADVTLYFVDVKSGKVKHCTLTNHCNDWDIEIIGEWGSQVLAIYDCDAEKAEDDAWDIKRYQFGLIEKDDLYHNRDKFQKIAMKGVGE